MSLDWFTVISQLVNLVILIILLKFLLYKPVLGAIDSRHDKIAQQIQQAQDKSDQADRQLEKYKQEKRDIENQKRQIMAEARQRAQKKEEELKSQAKSDIESKTKNWERQIRSRKKQFLQRLLSTAVEEVYEVADKVLADLGDQQLQQKIVNKLIEKLDQAGDEDENGNIKKALKQGGNKIEVRSDYELSDDRKKKMKEAIQKLSQNGSEIEFKDIDEHIGGIEIMAGDRRISWNIKSFLDRMKHNVEKVLDEKIFDEFEPRQDNSDQKESANPQPQSGDNVTGKQ